MVQWVVPNTTNSNLTTSIHAEGAQTVIDVQALDASGKPQDSLEMHASLVGANGLTQEIALTQIAPGEYHASVTSPLQGTYIVQIAGAKEGQVVTQETAGMVVPYSPEYRQGQSNPGLLDALARASGGVRLSQPSQAFTPLPDDVSRAQEIALPLLLLVLLLLPLDIGVRRLMLRRSDFAGARAWAGGLIARPTPPTAPNRQMEELRRAKARAAQRTDRSAPASVAPPAAPNTTPQPPAQPGADEAAIERLRAVRERARRRARGEE
jgi:hypothetical protein